MNEDITLFGIDNELLLDCLETGVHGILNTLSHLLPLDGFDSTQVAHNQAYRIGLGQVFHVTLLAALGEYLDPIGMTEGNQQRQFTVDGDILSIRRKGSVKRLQVLEQMRMSCLQDKPSGLYELRCRINFPWDLAATAPAMAGSPEYTQWIDQAVIYDVRSGQPVHVVWDRQVMLETQTLEPTAGPAASITIEPLVQAIEPIPFKLVDDDEDDEG